jgi:hypothetical protein
MRLDSQRRNAKQGSSAIVVGSEMVDASKHLSPLLMSTSIRVVNPVWPDGPCLFYHYTLCAVCWYVCITLLFKFDQWFLSLDLIIDPLPPF